MSSTRQVTRKRTGKSIKSGILNDFITEPSVRRLYLMAGGKRISAEAVEVLRKWVYEFAYKIIEMSIMVAESAKRKTITVDDLILAIGSMGKKYYAAKGQVFTRCTSRKMLIKSAPGSKSALRKQMARACLYMSRARFRNLIKHVIEQVSKSGMKISRDFSDNAQYYVEAQMIVKLRVANDVVGYAGHVTLKPRELDFIRQSGKLLC